MKRKIIYRCEIFKCNGGNPCCYYCNNKDSCRNPCLNDPAKCGKMTKDYGKMTKDDSKIKKVGG